MNRRAALEKTTWMLTSAIFAPSILSALQSCKQKTQGVKDLLVLSADQNNLVVAIADTIIPRTETVSASDVQVNEFIDLLLQDVFDEQVKQAFLNGLSEFDNESKNVTGKSFVQLSGKDRHNYLKKVDEGIMGKVYQDKVPFYYTFKQLTLKTYFSSEKGVKQNLEYVPIPGSYQADIDLREGSKRMVGN
ncbi:gluconate 2-dehydrogenase subunit 3 family protein [Reichenbachiella sp. MALMAid0571]|uniref:gluconate 2-dehydrogenase subunit 3 family protein n=1 Tax=Reichenbachiella sp. MALMAid0571 TaxID=3143939 RepID=UPI0032DF1181